MEIYIYSILYIYVLYNIYIPTISPHLSNEPAFLCRQSIIETPAVLVVVSLTCQSAIVRPADAFAILGGLTGISTKSFGFGLPSQTLHVWNIVYIAELCARHTPFIYTATLTSLFNHPGLI